MIGCAGAEESQRSLSLYVRIYNNRQKKSLTNDWTHKVLIYFYMFRDIVYYFFFRFAPFS